MINSKRSGVGADDVVEPKLWCFNQLEFLKPHCAIRKSVSNIPEIDEMYTTFLENEETITVDNEPEPEIQTSSSKRKRTEKFQDRLSNVKSLIAKKLEEKSEYDWLGKQVVFEMNRIKNKAIQIETAWKTQSILREAYLQASASRTETISSQTLSGFRTTTVSSFTNLSSEEGLSFSGNHLIRPTSISPSTSYSSSPAFSQSTAHNYTPSPDILALSMQGVIDEQDF